MAKYEHIKSEIDPRGLIHDAYQMEGIGMVECRSIFLDWALETAGEGQIDFITRLKATYLPLYPDHPMTEILNEALLEPSEGGRRGGSPKRRGRA